MKGLFKLMIGIDFFEKCKEKPRRNIRLRYSKILEHNIVGGREYEREPPYLEELNERPDNVVWKEMVVWLTIIADCSVIDQSILDLRPSRPLNDISLETLYMSHMLMLMFHSILSLMNGRMRSYGRK